MKTLYLSLYHCASSPSPRLLRASSILCMHYSALRGWKSSILKACLAFSASSRGLCFDRLPAQSSLSSILLQTSCGTSTLIFLILPTQHSSYRNEKVPYSLLKFELSRKSFLDQKLSPLSQRAYLSLSLFRARSLPRQRIELLLWFLASSWIKQYPFIASIFFQAWSTKVLPSVVAFSKYNMYLGVIRLTSDLSLTMQKFN